MAAASVFAAFIAIAAVAALCPMPGEAAEGPSVTTPNDRALAQRLVTQTINSYMSYARMPFTEGVSDDFPKDKYSFVNRVERKYYKARPSQLDFWINTVNRTGDKLAVSFTWNKKVMVLVTGQQQKNKGQSMFVYRQENGAWRLYDIKGNSPL